MKIQIITPLYEVVENLMIWADDCFEKADKHALEGSPEMAKKWAAAGFEAEKIAFEFTTSKRSNKDSGFY
tara:strand:- start:249 stop:458 length:210 start_codon:yes stop_codon:yes gene_type:complete